MIEVKCKSCGAPLVGEVCEYCGTTNVFEDIQPIYEYEDWFDSDGVYYCSLYPKIHWENRPPHG